MDIHGFLALPHRFRWGGMSGDDCMTFAASWARYAIGVDPAEDLRGTYRTRDEAHSIIAAHGGAVRFMDRHLVGIGCKRVQQPETGDIGLVRMMTSDEDGQAVEAEVGAVRFGPVWASIAPGGVIGRKADMVACWRLPA